MLDRCVSYTIKKDPRRGGTKQGGDPIPEPWWEAVPLEKLKDENFWQKRLLVPNSLTKKTTCESNCQKIPPSQWWQRPQATRGACRHRQRRKGLAIPCSSGTFAVDRRRPGPLVVAGHATLHAGDRVPCNMPPLHVVAGQAGPCSVDKLCLLQGADKLF
jgi:hypothetical protein